MKDKVVTVAVPGTCGEFVQGWWPDWEQPVLVSCPIAQYSYVSVRLKKQPGIVVKNQGKYDKLKRAIFLTLSHMGAARWGVEISINSQLLSGRGMAASTADIVGAIAGLGFALDHPFTPGGLATLACQIEPSDSTMFEAVTLLAYRNAGRYETIAPALSTPLLMLDPGYTVDTVVFNAGLNLAIVQQLGASTQKAIKLLKKGLQQQDIAIIGAAATLSAKCYQTVWYNHLLPRIEKWASETRAQGIIRAHSGGLFGLLFREQASLEAAQHWISQRFAGTITATHLAPGGYHRVEQEHYVR